MRTIGTDPLLISMQWAKLQSVVDEASVTLLRTAIYSGRYRPAWRIIQMGVVSVGSRRAALSSRLFCRAGVSMGTPE